MYNKAIRDGRPRPPRHQVGWDIVRRECACQISWWSVEKWRRYYILKFHGNTFRWPTTLTFDLKFWKYLSVTEYPYSMCMLSFMMIGWEMTEILHFEILRKHGQKHGQTHKQTDMGITIPRPPPMGGEVTRKNNDNHGGGNKFYIYMYVKTWTSLAIWGPGGGGGGGRGLE